MNERRPEISRRHFIEGALRLTAATFLAGSTMVRGDKQVEAAQSGYNSSPSLYWDKSIVEKDPFLFSQHHQLEIPRILTLSEIHGLDSNFMVRATDFGRPMRYFRRGQIVWAHYPLRVWEAKEQRVDRALIDETWFWRNDQIKEELAKEIINDKAISLRIRQALLAFLHGGDVALRPSFGPNQNIPANIEWVLKRFIETREPFVANIPADQSGDWFRGADQEIDENGESILAVRPAWQPHNWAPFDDEYAAQNNLMPMHQTGGPLDLYDRTFGTHARQQEAERAGWILDHYPQLRTSGGWCHGFANAGVRNLPLAA